MKIRLLLTNTSLVVVGLLLAQLPGASQGQKPAGQKITTEAGWYKYGVPYPGCEGARPRGFRTASPAWKGSGRRRAART